MNGEAVYYGFNSNFVGSFGQGKTTLENGEEEMIEYLHGKRHGPFEKMYSSGNRRTGVYRNDKIHGSATLFCVDGQILDETWNKGSFIVGNMRNVNVDAILEQ